MLQSVFTNVREKLEREAQDGGQVGCFVYLDYVM